MSVNYARVCYAVVMAQSKAHQDRANVEASLRRHGFDDAGVAAFFDAEAEIQRRERAKRAANRKPVQAETLFDF